MKTLRKNARKSLVSTGRWTLRVRSWGLAGQKFVPWGVMGRDDT